MSQDEVRNLKRAWAKMGEHIVRELSVKFKFPSEEALEYLNLVDKIESSGILLFFFFLLSFFPPLLSILSTKFKYSSASSLGNLNFTLSSRTICSPIFAHALFRLRTSSCDISTSIFFTSHFSLSFDSIFFLS